MTPPSEAQLVRIGESLREIDPSTLQQDDDEGPVRWFLGDSGTEIFAWLDGEGRAQHVQLVFARVSVDWSLSEGLKTGSFSGGSAIAGGRYDGYLMQVAQRADPDVCRAALTMMRAARGVEGFFGPFLVALEQAADPESLPN